MKSCIILAVALLGFQGIASVSGQTCEDLPSENTCITDSTLHCGWDDDNLGTKCKACTDYNTDSITCVNYEGCGYDSSPAGSDTGCMACDQFDTNQNLCNHRSGCVYDNAQSPGLRCHHCGDFSDVTACNTHSNTCLWVGSKCEALEECSSSNSNLDNCLESNQGCGYAILSVGSSAAHDCIECAAVSGVHAETDCKNTNGCGWSEAGLACSTCSSWNNDKDSCDQYTCCEWTAGTGDEGTCTGASHGCTESPTDTPTDSPTDTPTDSPTDTPTDTPTDSPTDTPTDSPK